MRSLTPLEQPRIPTAFAGRAPSGMLGAARAGIQASFAVVGYKGRTWSIKHRGDNTIVKDDRGRPAAELEVVIVGVASGVSKIFYQKNYSEGDDFAPDCFSLDGVTPDAQAPHKQNPVCQTCPQNQFGSAVNADTGRRGKACKDSRRIAVVPLGDIANSALGGPMLLRIPPTSLPNLASYSDFLELKGADFPYVGTVLGFDYEVAYPKITFKAMGFLDDEQAAEVVEVMADPLIQRMLNEAGPTAPAPAQEAVGELTGRPAAAFQNTKQIEAPPPKVITLKQPETKTAVAPAATPAPRGRPRKQQQAPPETAPSDLGSMIDDLLGGDDAA